MTIPYTTAEVKALLAFRKEYDHADALPVCPVCGKSEEHSAGCRNDPRNRADLDTLAVRYANLQIKLDATERKLARAVEALRAIVFDPFGPSDIDNGGFIRLITKFASAEYAALTSAPESAATPDELMHDAAARG